MFKIFNLDEVSRSLAACQGCILLVDCAQGVQAQTVANFYLAFGQGLEIIPVLNKIDLPGADIKKTRNEIQTIFEINEEPLCVSAKTGINMDQLLPHIIKNIPPPPSSISKNFRALLFDSWYDQFVGVVCLIAVGDGSVMKGDKITSAFSNLSYIVTDAGFMHPDQQSTTGLFAGQVGYIVLGMKTVREAFIGDTFFHSNILKSQVELYPNFEAVKSMVYSGVFPVDGGDFHKLSEAIERLTLNDSSLSVSKESSVALGQGFRIGYLGKLHMDVFQQRLEQEHGTSIINTTPTVPYKIVIKGVETIIRNPADFPDPVDFPNVDSIMEPMVVGTLIFPSKYTGSLIDLCTSHRGEQLDYIVSDPTRVMIKYKIPLSEILTNFYSQLKSRSSGFASFDYEEAGYQDADLSKITFMLNGKIVDCLSVICNKTNAERAAKNGVFKLKKVIDRGLVDISIQGCVDGKIVARESIKAVRKDVTAKCYGGDVTRRMKLLDKQKAGKKRMKSIVGGINLPHEAFLTLLEEED